VSCVVALAGRRIDAPGAPERFPARNRELVGARIAERLRALEARAVVASAACGADLLAHQAAHALGIRSRVILPFAPERFRETSVVDRGDEWGSLFDDVTQRAVAAGALRVLDGAGEGDAAYDAVNAAILEEAATLAAASAPVVEVRAVVVWDGSPRGGADLTAAFADRARERGFPVEVVATR
jgi:hypothetical protein